MRREREKRKRVASVELRGLSSRQFLPVQHETDITALGERFSSSSPLSTGREALVASGLCNPPLSPLVSAARAELLVRLLSSSTAPKLSGSIDNSSELPRDLEMLPLAGRRSNGSAPTLRGIETS